MEFYEGPPLSSSAVAADSKSAALLDTADILRQILELLSPKDLARAACVCREWNGVAADREVIEKTFVRSLKVKRIIGDPSSPGFWRHSGINKFAISHKIQREDSVTSLALKYSVQATDIKRLNNMMSDHGINSRERLLIPIHEPNILHDKTCYIELDTYAKREVAVLYLDGHPGAEYLARNSRIISRYANKKILNSVRRSMGVDNDGTAEYYLSLSSGDPRAAMMEFYDDNRWELEHQNQLHHHGGKRTTSTSIN